MATWQAEVEAHVGSLSSYTTQASSWLSRAAFKLLPIARINDPELAPTRVVDSTTGVAITHGMRCLYGDKSGRRADLVEQGNWAKASDSGSLEYATAYTPVMVIKDDFRVYILPGGGSVFYITAASYTDITTTYAGLFGSSILGTLAVLDIAIQAMTFFMEAITTASLATQYNALGTSLDTNEDIELAGAKMNEIGTRLQKAGVSVETCKQKIAMLKMQYDALLQSYLGLPKIDSVEGERK